MATTEYTDRILPGEQVYLAPNGRFHRPGCRYYVAPGPDATFVEGTFTAAFLSNHCKLCFPQGVPALEALAARPFQAPPAAPPSAPPSAPLAPESPAPEPPAPAPEPAGADGPPPAAPPPPVAPPPGPASGTGELRGGDERRKRRKKQRFAVRPPAITRVQVAIFVGVVGLGVAVFVVLAAFLNWFG